MNDHQSRFLWWILGAIFGPVCLGVFTSILNTTFDSVQRISILETEIRGVRHDLEGVHKKLDRMLEKLP